MKRSRDESLELARRGVVNLLDDTSRAFHSIVQSQLEIEKGTVHATVTNPSSALLQGTMERISRSLHQGGTEEARRLLHDIYMELATLQETLCKVPEATTSPSSSSPTVLCAGHNVRMWALAVRRTRLRLARLCVVPTVAHALMRGGDARGLATSIAQSSAYYYEQWEQELEEHLLARRRALEEQL